jgi:hypothetical protein
VGAMTLAALILFILAVLAGKFIAGRFGPLAT